MRVLDCKNDDCKELTKNAPKILDYICDDCKGHFEAVKNLLTVAGIDYKINAGIVRGLDYYTKTVFEFVSENIGAQGTVCGGGRYDRLVSEFGGPNVPGIGFATGIERLLLLLENSGVEIPNDKGVKIYLAPMGEKETIKAFELTNKLRSEGIIAETDHMGRGIKAQFKYADKIGAKMVAVLGSNELENGEIKVKNMLDGKEENVKFENLVSYVKEK
jgi:histidyl-tRNA synthetase